MTILFAVDGADDDLVKAIQTLDGLAGGGKIVTRKSLTIETQDVRLGLILAQMVQGFDLRIGGELPGIRDTVGGMPAEPKETSPQPSPEGKGGTRKRPNLAPKKCEVCGEEYNPNRHDQRLCGKPECKRGRAWQRMAEDKPKKAAEQTDQEYAEELERNQVDEHFLSETTTR